MCDVSVPLLLMTPPPPAPPPPPPTPDLPAGLLTLSQQEYRSLVHSEPIDQYYEVSPTPICSGQWASVYKCRLRSTGAEFAAKFCDKWRMGADASREIVHEMAVMHRCRGCARVVRLQQLFETPTQFVLVMELGCGGDLQGVLDSDQVPYEPDVIRFVRNLLEGLIFLHEQDIAHLDIKPQNMVLTGPFPDCDVKLCDLEISRQLRPGREVRDMLGTPDYVAPEILRFDAITLAADMWSVGVLTYVLLTGFTPFGGDTDAETFRNIASAEPEFPDELFEDVSEAAKDFVRSCLHKQPRDRISAVESLQHRWLQPAASPSAPPTLNTFLSVPSAVQLATDTYQPGTLRRSISKSREVLSVKVSRSNLKKNISKSRDRLCDMKFGVAKSASVDQFPLTLRASMSRLPDASGGRPPWRGGGVLCTAPSLNTFQVRDQYQNQVAAMLGGGSPDTEGVTTAVFVRQNSQRGRKKCSAPQMEAAVGRSSLRHQGRKKNSDSALIRRSCEHVNLPLKEPVPEIIVHLDRPEPVASIDGSHASNEAILPLSQDDRNPPVPFTASESHENVFARLYRGGKKDTVMNTKQVNGDIVEIDTENPTFHLPGEENNPQNDEEKPKTKPSIPKKPTKQTHGNSTTAGEPHESEKENSRPNSEEGCSLTPIFIEYCTDVDRNAKSELDSALLDMSQSGESPQVETGGSLPYQTETLRQKPVQHAPECHIVDFWPERSQLLTSAVPHKENASPVIQKPVPPPRKVLKSKSASEVHLALEQPVEIRVEKGHSTTSQRHQYQKSKSYHDLVSKVFSETPLEEWKLITEDTLIQVKQEPHHIMKKAIPVQTKRDQQNPLTGKQLSKTLPRPSHKFSNRKIIVEEPEKEGPEQNKPLDNQQWTWPALQQPKPSLPPKPSQSVRTPCAVVAEPSVATTETSSSTTLNLQKKENKTLHHSSSKNLTTASTNSTAASRDCRKPSAPSRACESFTRYGSLRRRKVAMAHPHSSPTQQPSSTAPSVTSENPPTASHRRQASAPVEVLSYVPAKERVQASHVRQRSAPVQMELATPSRHGAPSDTPRAVQKHRSMDALKGCEGTVQKVRGRTTSEQGISTDHTLCRKASGSAKVSGQDGSFPLNDRAETPARAKRKDQGTNTEPQGLPKYSSQQGKHHVGVNTEPPTERCEVGVNTDNLRRVASIQNAQIVWEHLEPPSANQQIHAQTASRQNSEKHEEAGNQPFVRGSAPRSSRRDACRRPSRPIPAPPGRTSSEGEGRQSRTPPTSPTEDSRLLLRKSSTDEDVRHLLSGSRDEKLPCGPPASSSTASRLQRPASLHQRSGSLTSDLGSSSDGGSETCIVVSFEERSPEPNGSKLLRPVTTRMPERRTCATAAAPSPRAQVLRQNSRALSAAGNQRVSSEERLPQKATGDAVSRAVSRFQSLARQARPKKPGVAFGRSASVREKHGSRPASLLAASPWV